MSAKNDISQNNLSKIVEDTRVTIETVIQENLALHAGSRIRKSWSACIARKSKIGHLELVITQLRTQLEAGK